MLSSVARLSTAKLFWGALSRIHSAASIVARTPAGGDILHFMPTLWETLENKELWKRDLNR